MNLISLGQATDSSPFAGHVISLVGGGGKSTLMYWAAEHLARAGKKVLVTTTTHIYRPSPVLFARRAEDVRMLWQQQTFAVIGTPSHKMGKLTLPDRELLEQLIPEADLVLVEADGSRQLPIKAPRAWEPVILPQTDTVLAVMGLSAIGQRLGQCCFGLEEAMALLGADQDHILTEMDAAQLLASAMGGRKNVGGCRFGVILNQCDNEARRESAARIAEVFHRQGIGGVWATFFDEEERRYFQKLAGAGGNEAQE